MRSCLFNSGHRDRKPVPVPDGGLHVLDKTHNQSLLFSPAHPLLCRTSICRRTGSTAAIYLAVVARGSWTLVLVDIPADVFCPDDRVLYFHDEKRMYGLHVARLDG